MDEFGNFNTLLNQPWTLPQQGYGNPMPSANSISPYQPANADPFNFQGRSMNMGFQPAPMQGQNQLALAQMAQRNAFSPFSSFMPQQFEQPNQNQQFDMGGSGFAGGAGGFGITGINRQMDKIRESMNDMDTGPDQMKSLSNQLDDLKAERNAIIGRTVLGAAPGVIGGIYGGITNLNRRNNLQREDLTPTQVYSGAADAFRREKSALTPNYAQTVDSINRRAGDVVKTAERVGGSAGQVIDAAISANTAAGDQLFNLDMAGADRQSRNRARADEYRNTLGEYQRMSDDRYKSQYAAYDRASKDSFMNAFNTAAGFGMMAV